MQGCPDCCQILDDGVLCARCEGSAKISIELISLCLLCGREAPRISYLWGGVELRWKHKLICRVTHDKLIFVSRPDKYSLCTPQTVVEEIKIDSKAPDFKLIIEKFKKIYQECC